MSRNKQRPITAEELEQIKGIIIYDPETGYLHRVKNGKRRGTLHPSGYRYVGVIGRNFYEHRLAWALYYNEDPYPYEIDHINRNRSDNVISNLRKATPAEQNMYKPPEVRSSIARAGALSLNAKQKAKRDAEQLFLISVLVFLLTKRY